MCTADLRGHDIGFNEIAEVKSNSVASIVCCRYVISYCLAVGEDVNTSSTNAFSILMASQHERHLPSKVGGDAPHSDQRLCNDLLDTYACCYKYV